jgi:hypothetical protein
MGTKNQPAAFDCYANAEPDEPMFILLARDKYAPVLVEQWARMRSTDIDKGERPESDRAQVKEAFACAKAMEQWHKVNR